MKIQKCEDYFLYTSMAEYFVESMYSSTNEENSSSFKEISQKVLKDLKLNTSIVAEFGAGLSALYPIVDGLIKNSKLSLNLTPESLVLLTISAFSIIYLEEKRSKMSASEQASLEKNCKSMLEELKLSGIGNGIVKKLVNGFKSIKNIFSLISKHIGSIVGGFIDMFAYTSLAIPILNGIYSIVGKYNLNLETLQSNFLGLAVGVGSLIAKHGISDILKKMKGKYFDKKKIIDEIDTPLIKKFGDADIDDQEGDLIKEMQ